MKTQLNYNVNGITGFTFDTFIRCCKSKFETFEEFKKVVRNIPEKGEGNSLENISSIWDEVVPMDLQFALTETNVEKRRAIFGCLKPEEYIEKIGTLVDTQTITKKHIRWDKNNKPYEHVFEDTYAIYDIKLDETSNGWNTIIRAVKCFCTTTNRKYFIFIPRWHTDDAIAAIAWTLRIPRQVYLKSGSKDYSEEYIDKIFRQGDILIIKWKDVVDRVDMLSSFTFLSRQRYIDLITSET